LKAENPARLKTLSQHFNGQMKAAAQSALELTASKLLLFNYGT